MQVRFFVFFQLSGFLVKFVLQDSFKLKTDISQDIKNQ